jgi:hypothetical protein
MMKMIPYEKSLLIGEELCSIIRNIQLIAFFFGSIRCVGNDIFKRDFKLRGKNGL